MAFELVHAPAASRGFEWLTNLFRVETTTNAISRSIRSSSDPIRYELFDEAAHLRRVAHDIESDDASVSVQSEDWLSDALDH